MTTLERITGPMWEGPALLYTVCPVPQIGYSSGDSVDGLWRAQVIPVLVERFTTELRAGPGFTSGTAQCHLRTGRWPVRPGTVVRATLADDTVPMSTTVQPTTTGSVAANGLEFAYETFGDRADPPMVLVMGVGGQMIAWPDQFCLDLAALGHFVVRFDNRDVGASTHLDGLPVPRIRDMVLRRTPPYSVEDLATDAIGVIEALDLGRVHLVGASMGGFISQTVAIRRPDLVRTLTLIMTSTGSQRVGRASIATLLKLSQGGSPEDRATNIDNAVRAAKLTGSTGFAMNEEAVRSLAGREFDRSHDPAGRMRHTWAVASQKNRTAQLAELDIPTLVMHGLVDKIVAPSGGMALARTIPGARFVAFAGMGHDLPRALWPEVVGHIGALTARG